MNAELPISVLEAALKEPSRRYDPLKLALAAQDDINKLRRKIADHGGEIRQLLQGRHVRCKTRNMIFLVTEVRIGLAGTAGLWGKKRGMSRAGYIGTLDSVELWEKDDDAAA